MSISKSTPFRTLVGLRGLLCVAVPAFALSLDWDRKTTAIAAVKSLIAIAAAPPLFSSRITPERCGVRSQVHAALGPYGTGGGREA